MADTTSTWQRTWSRILNKVSTSKPETVIWEVPGLDIINPLGSRFRAHL